MALPSGYTGNDDHSKSIHMIVTIFCAHLRNYALHLQLTFVWQKCTFVQIESDKNVLRKGAKQFAIPFLQSTHW